MEDEKALGTIDCFQQTSATQHLSLCNKSKTASQYTNYCLSASSQSLKSHLVRTQCLNVLPLKPGVGQCIAIHATLTARDFFLVYFLTLPVHSPAFFQILSRFLLCWLWLTYGSCVGPQNKIGHPAGCRFPCRVPAEYK